MPRRAGYIVALLLLLLCVLAPAATDAAPPGRSPFASSQLILK